MVIPASAYEPADALLDAKIAVVELSAIYGPKHPRLVEATGRVDALSQILPAVPPAAYAACLQEHLRAAERQDAEASLRYGEKHPERVVLTDKISALRLELERTGH